MHGNAVIITGQGQQGRVFGTGQQCFDLFEFVFRGMQHDVFAFFGLHHTIDAGQQLVNELLLRLLHLTAALN